MRISRFAAISAALGALLAAGAAAQSSARAVWAAQSAAPKAPAKSPPRTEALPSAPAGDWTALLENVRDNGKYEPGDVTYPPHFSFEDISGAKDAAHKADYVTVFGSIGEEDGLFHPGSVDVVSEDWAVDEKKNWRIEQWMFRVGVDGRARDAMHNILYETPDGHVLGEDELAPGAEAKAHFDALIKRWTQYKPAK